MTPSEAFVETLVANDRETSSASWVRRFMDAMDIFPPAGIRLIPVVHEQGAGHMADGYARASGRHWVVIGKNGPGIVTQARIIVASHDEWRHGEPATD